MRISIVLALLALPGFFAAGVAMADGDAPVAAATDGASATTMPDIQALQSRMMDCKAALKRAQDECIKRVEESDEYKSAAADLEEAKTELNSASDADSRAKAATDRMAATAHIKAIKAAALASDKAVAAAAAVDRKASDDYQTALLQNSAAATASGNTMAQGEANSGSGPSADDDATKEMLERGEKQRLATEKTLLDDIRRLDDELGKIPENGATDPRREEINQSIIKDRQIIATGEKLKGKFLPDLEMVVGSTGTIYSTMHVLQVIDGNNMLLNFGESSVCWVKGFDTTGLVDDEIYVFRGALRVSGTRQYTNMAGTSQTVFVIEPFGTP